MYTTNISLTINTNVIYNWLHWGIYMLSIYILIKFE